MTRYKIPHARIKGTTTATHLHALPGELLVLELEAERGGCYGLVVGAVQGLQERVLQGLRSENNTEQATNNKLATAVAIRLRNQRWNNRCIQRANGL
jgi:hypothetical protein